MLLITLLFHIISLMIVSFKICFEELVAERHRQGLTQSDIADRTGMKASNIARLENGSGIPTLVVLEKYASALGKHISD